VYVCIVLDYRKILNFPGTEPRFLGLPGCSLFTITTTLSWLLSTPSSISTDHTAQQGTRGHFYARKNENFKYTNECLASEHGSSIALGSRNCFHATLCGILSLLTYFCTPVAYHVTAIEVVSLFYMSAVSWRPYEEHFVLRFMATSTA